jgi:hypothetical protein
MSEPRVARVLSDVNEGVELRLRRKRGNCDRLESAGSERQDGSDM